MEKIFAVSIAGDERTTEEVAQWMSSEKLNDTHRPVCRGERGYFSFQMRGMDGFFSWSGESRVERHMTVEVDNNDLMFFWEHGSTYGVETGRETYVANSQQGILTTAERYAKIRSAKVFVFPGM